MGIEEQTAVSFYSGSLSPNVQQAVARAKDVAQRVLPSQTSDPTLRMDRTDVTLVVDPALRLVVDRVTDVDTGAVLSLLPSSEPSPLAERSRRTSDPVETPVAPSRQIAESRPADRSVATSVQLVEARYQQAGRTTEIVPKSGAKTQMTI